MNRHSAPPNCSKYPPPTRLSSGGLLAVPRLLSLSLGKLHLLSTLAHNEEPGSMIDSEHFTKETCVSRKFRVLPSESTRSDINTSIVLFTLM